MFEIEAEAKNCFLIKNVYWSTTSYSYLIFHKKYFFQRRKYYICISKPTKHYSWLYGRVTGKLFSHEPLSKDQVSFKKMTTYEED